MLHARAGALLHFCAGGASDSAMVSTQRKTSRRSASYDSRGVERAHWREEPGSATAATSYRSWRVALSSTSDMCICIGAAGMSTQCSPGVASMEGKGGAHPALDLERHRVARPRAARITAAGPDTSLTYL